MSKKTFLLILIIIFFYSNLLGETKLELFSGFRTMNDSIYKSTYGKGSFDYGLSFQIGFLKVFDIITEGNFYYDTGKTTLSEEKISFFMLTPSLGLRLGYEFTKIIGPYVGGGVCYCFFNENSPLGNTTDKSRGYQIEVGNYIYLSKKLRLDLNFKLIKIDTLPYEDNLSLQGIRFGIGICQIL